MAFELNVTADLRRAERQLKGFQKKKLPAALVRAINKTATQTRTTAARDLRKGSGASVGLTAAGFTRAIALIRATRLTFQATLRASGRPIPLIFFGAREVASGVSVAPFGKRKILKNAFIERMPSGHRGVFRRTKASQTAGGTAKSGRARKNYLPIRERFGPSLPAQFLTAKLQAAMRRVVKIRWPINFNREIRNLKFKLR